MVYVHEPPGRKSIWCVVLEKPLGPHQRSSFSAAVQASKTLSRGASNVRETTTSRSAVSLGLLVAIMSFLLKCFQIFIQPVEALFPELSIPSYPVRHLLEGFCLEPAGPPLGLPPLLDQPGLVQHLQVLRDAGEAE